MIKNDLEKYYVKDILEVACGVGHMMAVLEEQGYGVTGLDLSEEMLKIARTRIKGELVNQDMRGIELERVFDAVLCLGSSFTYMKREEDVDNALRCFNNCLRDGGILIFDNFNASRFDVSSHGKWEENVFCFDGLKIRRFVRSSCWNDKDLTWRVDWKYLIEKGVETTEVHDNAELRAFHESYLRDKLSQHGFNVLRLLDERRLMILAQKQSSN